MDTLPIEIRSTIYRLAVQHNELIPAGSPSSHEPAILSVCSEARAEALQHFYSSNTFRIDVVRIWERGNCEFRSKAKDWLLAIGPEKASWIKRSIYNHAASRHRGRECTGERLEQLKSDLVKDPTTPRVDC